MPCQMDKSDLTHPKRLDALQGCSQSRRDAEAEFLFPRHNALMCWKLCKMFVDIWSEYWIRNCSFFVSNRYTMKCNNYRLIETEEETIHGRRGQRRGNTLHGHRHVHTFKHVISRHINDTRLLAPNRRPDRLSTPPPHVHKYIVTYWWSQSLCETRPKPASRALYICSLFWCNGLII